MDDIKKKAVCYIKLGSQNNEIALKVQEEKLERFAKMEGIHVVRKLQDVSGSISASHPGFIEMKEMCLNGEVNCVLVADVDRISQDMEEVFTFLNCMDSRGIDVMTPDRRRVELPRLDRWIKSEISNNRNIVGRIRV